MTLKIPIRPDIGWNARTDCRACLATYPQEAGFTIAFDTLAAGMPRNGARVCGENSRLFQTITHRTLPTTPTFL